MSKMNYGRLRYVGRPTESITEDSWYRDAKARKRQARNERRRVQQKRMGVQKKNAARR
jgi:hypothetical protein